MDKHDRLGHQAPEGDNMDRWTVIEGGGQTLDVAALMRTIGQDTRAAQRALATVSSKTKAAALVAAAATMRQRMPAILEANGRDMADAQRRDLAAAALDRLRLDAARRAGIARGGEEIAGLPDPVGRVLARIERPNGLVIERVSTPLGVVGVIYESRPNVTADAGALCLKAGNAAILRGGSESFFSSEALHACLEEGLLQVGLPAAAINRVPTRDRAAVGAMLAGLEGAIDVLVPRGGKALVARVQAEARVPVFAHLEGIVHVYVDRAADPERAREILVNSKMRRTGICGAAETLLVDRAAPGSMLPMLVKALLEAGCAVRGDPAVQATDGRVTAASEEDWRTEYLDSTIRGRGA